MPFSPLPEQDPSFSVSPTATTQLEHSLERAVRSRADAMERLHRAVDACVADLHRLGMTPERVLITIKALVRRTAAEHPPPGYTPSTDAADAFIAEIVRWSLVEYFRLEHPRDGPTLPSSLPEAGPS